MAAFKKRVIERYDMELPVTLYYQTDKGKQQSLELTTRNVSSRGAFLETGKALPLGTPVKLNMTLPLHKFKNLSTKNASVALSGDVIRSEETGMAICFDENFRITPVT